jgi:hypothetical protein
LRSELTDRFASFQNPFLMGVFGQTSSLKRTLSRFFKLAEFADFKMLFKG